MIFGLGLLVLPEFDLLELELLDPEVFELPELELVELLDPEVLDSPNPGSLVELEVLGMIDGGTGLDFIMPVKYKARNTARPINSRAPTI